MLKLLLALAVSATAADTKFEISYPATANPGPITGRVYVMITRSTDREPRPGNRPGRHPVLRPRIEKLAPAKSAEIDATDVGTPVVSLSEIPPGDYWVQASSTSIPNSTAPTAT